MEKHAKHWGANSASNSASNIWHCVAVSDWVGPAQVKAVWAGAEDVVLWRQPDGQLHAWRNQCPHRGVRLSLGCVRNNRLACRYHGWQFDSTGQCAYVPADPNFAPSAALHADCYACNERDGLVWVGVSEEEPPGAVLSDAPTGLRSLHIAGPAVQVHEWLVTQPLPTLSGHAPVMLDKGTTVIPSLLEFPRPSGASIKVALAVQAQLNDETALHASAVLPGEDDAALKLALLRWLQSLRSAVERAMEATVAVATERAVP